MINLATTTATQCAYLRSGEVAALLQVSPKTVTRWAQQGQLPFLRTPGGHRRYPEPAIQALREQLWAGRQADRSQP